MKGIKKQVLPFCVFIVQLISKFETIAAHGSMFHPHAWLESQEKLPSNKKCSALSIKWV